MCCIDRLISRSKQNCESLTYLASHCYKRFLRIGKVSVTASDARNFGEKIHYFEESGENIPKRRNISRHGRGVYKNFESVKYAKVTISTKGPAYLPLVSCEYAERSPLHFVLWLELSSSRSCNVTRANRERKSTSSHERANFESTTSQVNFFNLSRKSYVVGNEISEYQENL